jgi:hypothetical protein
MEFMMSEHAEPLDSYYNPWLEMARLCSRPGGCQVHLGCQFGLRIGLRIRTLVGVDQCSLAKSYVLVVRLTNWCSICYWPWRLAHCLPNLSLHWSLWACSSVLMIGRVPASCGTSWHIWWWCHVSRSLCSRSRSLTLNTQLQSNVFTTWYSYCYSTISKLSLHTKLKWYSQVY